MRQHVYQQLTDAGPDTVPSVSHRVLGYELAPVLPHRAKRYRPDLSMDDGSPLTVAFPETGYEFTIVLPQRLRRRLRPDLSIDDGSPFTVAFPELGYDLPPVLPHRLKRTLRALEDLQQPVTAVLFPTIGYEFDLVLPQKLKRQVRPDLEDLTHKVDVVLFPTRGHEFDIVLPDKKKIYRPVDVEWFPNIVTVAFTNWGYDLQPVLPQRLIRRPGAKIVLGADDPFVIIWSVVPLFDRWELIYDDSDWGGAVGPTFFARMRATTGSVHARLWDRTAGAAVAEVSTSSSSFVRVETGVLDLVDGHSYTPHFGVQPRDAGEYLKSGWSVGLR